MNRKALSVGEIAMMEHRLVKLDGLVAADVKKLGVSAV